MCQGVGFLSDIVVEVKTPMEFLKATLNMTFICLLLSSTFLNL